ncbi:MAG: chromosomal replication initiator protein DnaA [Lachnospiraceae bacterium]|nr:chromosomal replication initiator protein DnaA [Lachnospiraceae bacterium]
MLETIKNKWPDILNHLKQEYDISDVSFNTWLLPLKVESVENDTIILVVPEESVGLQIIKKKYYLPLKVSVEEVVGAPFEIEFVLPTELKQTAAALSKQEASEQMDVFEKAGLNPKYTFSSFVVGENNNLAHAAALAVAESPAEIYNPLYIYGGVGLGKTHLMQAIAHFILQHNPSMKVLYVTSETFTNEIIDAIRVRNDNPMANTLFREKYRNVDVLLIDDIQFISGKESTQQEFFHTFNALYENKKQIIISSDKPPKEIDNLEERLCSRFLWGLPVDIQSPNYETRVAILKKKIELEGVTGIDDSVINYIATNVNSNIRELEGALTKIVAYSKLTSSEITLEFAGNVLHDLFNEAQQEITPDIIIKIVAEHFNVSISDICSKKKSADIVYPRQLIMYLCRTLTDVALSLIGKKLGNRDHTTILHGYEKIQKDIEKNEKVHNDVEILKKKIIPS